VIDIHPKIRNDLAELQRKLSEEGVPPPPEKLQSYYAAFRKEFGSDVLRSLDGQQLLERMHAHGSKESLVYWLEFKDDDVFPAMFGSIAGGSALKFGVYRRAETGTWAKGNGNTPQDIPLTEAIGIARRHREQLLAACDLVGALPRNADDAAYLSLQRDLKRVSPDIEDTAWGHKYLSLIFPDVLDDFHVASYQRYHLARMLQLPPRDKDGFAEGRFVCAGKFVALAHLLQMPVHSLTTLLNRRDGVPKTYWRIGTTDDETQRRKYWPTMRDQNIVAIGWPAVGDLSSYTNNRESRDSVIGLLNKHYSNTPQAVGRSATQLLSLRARMFEGDRIIAADGQTVVGIGEVTGPYGFDPSSPLPHYRPVRWLSVEEWKLPVTEGLRTTVASIKDLTNHVEIERRILDDPAPAVLPTPSEDPPNAVREKTVVVVSKGQPQRLTGVMGQVQGILERKGQAILYGPPGTGKTHWALRTARELASLRAFDISYEYLSVEQKSRLMEGSSTEPSLVRMASFHPEYGYEDFIEGYRPVLSAEGSLSFELRAGMFRRMCADAASAPALDFYLMIDEINRGDVPRIFGELLTLLERDKRGQAMILPASGEPFRVPPNVYVLGTMNTADRSIALLDVALRRRFGFIELMPDYGVLKGASIGDLPLGPWLAELNRRIRASGGGDARNRQIGHAFLMESGAPIATSDKLAAVLRDDIVPLLEEFAYDDFGQLVEMLGSGLVDQQGQRIKRELFEADRATDLIAALLSPEIATTAAAVMTTAISGADADADAEADDKLDEHLVSRPSPT
jgi:5-methylcytosine-specific restriction enzyme B